MAKAAPEQTGNAVQSIDEIRAQIRKEAELLSGRIQSGGGDKVILTKQKTFKLPDGSESEGPMSVVILEFVSRNDFYDRPYDPTNIIPPSCFAIGDDPQRLVPDELSPAKEAEACKGCPNDEFGSKGKGKACSNQRLLAVTDPSGTGPIYVIKVPAGSIKAFDGYVRTVKAQFGTVPIGVVTDVYFDKDKDFQSLLFGNPTPNENLVAHFARRQEAKDKIWAKPDVSSYEAPKKKR